MSSEQAVIDATIIRNLRAEISRLRSLCDDAGIDWLPGAIDPNQIALFGGGAGHGG